MNEPPSDWERRCGFRSSATAAATRRREDQTACSLIGARPIWLSFADSDHEGKVDSDAVLDEIAAAAVGAELVLIPGFPLMHPDHRWLARLILNAEPFGHADLGVYVEQPYALTWLLGRDSPLGREAPILQSISTAVHWLGRREALRARLSQELLSTVGGLQPMFLPNRAVEIVRAPNRARLLKWRAVRAYRSQLRGLRPLVAQAKIACFEAAVGGEAVAFFGRPS